MRSEDSVKTFALMLCPTRSRPVPPRPATHQLLAASHRGDEESLVAQLDDARQAVAGPEGSDGARVVLDRAVVVTVLQLGRKEVLVRGKNNYRLVNGIKKYRLVRKK